MRTAVVQPVDAPCVAYQDDLLAAQGDRPWLLFAQVARGHHRVPVVAEAQRCRAIARPLVPHLLLTCRAGLLHAAPPSRRLMARPDGGRNTARPPLEPSGRSTTGVGFLGVLLVGLV